MKGFPRFLPASVNQLTEPSSINLTRKIKRIKIQTSLHQQAINTAYVQDGQGNPPILLLHGFDSSLLEFCHLFPLLTQTHETWAVDLLGFGFTERFRDISYTPESIKHHLYAFWKTAITQPVILVGASMGGATAIDFTLTYPEAVNKLVLINSVGYSGSFPLGLLLFSPLDALAVEFWRQRKWQGLFWSQRLGLVDAVSVDAIRCALLPSEMPLWSDSIACFTKSGGYLHLAAQIPHVKKPTLILWGTQDQELGTEDAYRFREAIAHSQLVWIKQAGHVPHWEQPEQVARQIRDFISKKL